MSREFKAVLTALAAEVQEYMQDCLKIEDIPRDLRKAMEYSLLAGGKKIRPVLCLSWGVMLGADRKELLPFAAALEMIHTYSLVHDDLPAMDNDDLRRGRPTNHKMFGEAVAILAGDALLTQAFFVMLDSSFPSGRVLAACREIAAAAGPQGMVGGQCLDLMATGMGSMNLEDLKNMHALKTGALIRASCTSGALLAGQGADVHKAASYGKNIGLAFQIVDDILDVTGDEQTLGKPVGSDLSADKSTYPKFLGIERSKAMAQDSAELAKACLDDYHGPQKEFLRSLAQYIVDRIC